MRCQITENIQRQGFILIDGANQSVIMEELVIIPFFENLHYHFHFKEYQSMKTQPYLKAFEDFLEQEIKQEDSFVIDYEQEKKEWLNNIDEFYNLIQAFIGDYLKQGKIIEERKIIKLQEDNFGEYEVEQLTLKIGKKRLIFTPVGRFVVGCNGRIDLDSSLGSVRFLLVPKDFDKPSTFFMGHFSPQTKWCWKIATPPPQVSYLELTQQSFFEALMEVANA